MRKEFFQRHFDPKSMLTGFLLALCIAILFLAWPCERFPADAEPPRIVAFGDSWLSLAKLNGITSPNICFGVSHPVLFQLINEHPAGEYDVVIIFGGINDIKHRNKSMEYARGWQIVLREAALEKWPNADIVVVAIDDIVDAYDDVYRRHKRVHLDTTGYWRLFIKYPLLESLYDGKCKRTWE